MPTENRSPSKSKAMQGFNILLHSLVDINSEALSQAFLQAREMADYATEKEKEELQVLKEIAAETEAKRGIEEEKNNATSTNQLIKNTSNANMSNRQLGQDITGS